MSDWIVAFIEAHGYAGIALLMLVENVFPPLPSELIMPFAGYVAAGGRLSAIGVVAAGTAGSLLGTLPWYLAGRLLGAARLKRWAARHGRWLTVSPDDIDHACRWFQRRGAAAVALGRLVPAVRSVISVPAGLAAMPWPAFLLWSLAGSLVWVGALTALGALFESRWQTVGAWLDPLAKAIVALALAGYLWRVARFKRNANHS